MYFIFAFYFFHAFFIIHVIYNKIINYRNLSKIIHYHIYIFHYFIYFIYLFIYFIYIDNIKSYESLKK